MKLKRTALLIVWVLILSTLSGCMHFSIDYLPDLFFEEDAPAESAAPAPTPEPTPSPTPEQDAEDAASAPALTPSTPSQSLDKPESWATTSNTTEVATGVEYAASQGLLSAVSVYCTFTEETGSNNFTYSYGFGFSPFYGEGGEGGEGSENVVQSAGSGVIYWLDKAAGNAFILTNYHVVYDVNSVTENKISDNIVLYLYGSELSGMEIPATYIGGSMNYDLAVLYVENSEVLRNSSAIAATFTNSNTVSAGQTAIAIGNPEAGGISVSSGVISVDSEYIAMTAVDEATQITMRVMRMDTAVNSGNSGGGLFDDTGCLIGIVNAKISSSSVENIAYAIPSNIVRYIADNIITHCFGTENESVQRGLLGIMVATTSSQAYYDEATRKTYILETVTVDSVSEGGAADGFLQAGDILTAVSVDGNYIPIQRRYDVVDAMLAASVGSSVTMEYLRDGVPGSCTMVLTAEDVSSY